MLLQVLDTMLKHPCDDYFMLLRLIKLATLLLLLLLGEKASGMGAIDTKIKCS